MLKMILSKAILPFVLCFVCRSLVAQPKQLSLIDLGGSSNFQKIGRGTSIAQEGGLLIEGAYVAIGENSWKNYSFEFDAKSTSSTPEVQIWAGFRAGNRDDRYVLALKGGAQNDLYLSRLGYMGADDFLALRHLDFTLEKNTFYHISVEVVGDRIRVFLNHEKEPRIDVTDKDGAYAAAGKITLGGGWLPTFYKNLKVRQAAPSEFDGLAKKEYEKTVPNKEKEREIQREAYLPVEVRNIGASAKRGNIEKNRQAAKEGGDRREISLNGAWLFAPGYMVSKDEDAYTPMKGDKNWHTMAVPAFWNPDRIWLFGEGYGTASKGVSDSYYQKEIDRCDAYTFDYKKTDIAWYRQWVDLPPEVSGKHMELSFDAVSKTCEVWVNGKKAGEHTGMFGAFQVDASHLLKPGKNLIAVKVVKDYIKNIENPDKIINVAASVEVTPRMLKDLPHGFFGDNPAGIWQPVSLIITNPLHIADVYIRSDSTSAQIQVTVQNSSNERQHLSLLTKIAPEKGIKLLYEGTDLENQEIKPNSTKTFTYQIKDVHPALWSPEKPALYNFDFTMKETDQQIVDTKRVRSGFKSFVIKDGLFYLNGSPYWLRGGNQSSMPLAPNDTALANKFSQIVHAANMAVVRTHTTPYTETWMNASDKRGVGISFEGTWPWLMLGDTEIPDKKLLDLWEKEMLALVKKYRNHPSLLMWTMNNEMKFYQLDPDLRRAKEKMRIISSIVKAIRKEDPEHPIVFDSNYYRDQAEKRFGKAFMDSIDDGDIDDIHQYTNWYDESIFDEFKGRFEKNHKYAGRPLISQEMSTGYPDETGHATRFYTFVHQNPSSLVGKFAYAYQDPRWFMQAQSFITKELGEALRRTNPQASGILQFSQATWFSQVYSVDGIKPNRTFYAMKKVLQPVLVTAELWGRHFYDGDALPTNICVVNDQADGQVLRGVTLVWKLTDSHGKTFATGKQSVEDVPFYGRTWIKPQIEIPADLPASRVDGKLELELHCANKIVSVNDYDLVFATRKWAASSVNSSRAALRVLDMDGKLSPALNDLKLNYTAVKSIKDLINGGSGVAVLAADDHVKLGQEDLKLLKEYTVRGGKLLMVHGGSVAAALFPDMIRGLIESNKEIANLEIPESPVFDELSAMDIRYFNNRVAELPTVLENSYQINRKEALTALASSVKIHGYLSGDTPNRMKTLDKLKGFPILLFNTKQGTGMKDDQGKVLLTTLNLEKGATDPIAGRLLSNLIDALLSGK